MSNEYNLWKALGESPSKTVTITCGGDRPDMSHKEAAHIRLFSKGLTWKVVSLYAYEVRMVMGPKKLSKELASALQHNLGRPATVVALKSYRPGSDPNTVFVPYGLLPRIKAQNPSLRWGACIEDVPADENIEQNCSVYMR
jgi:hypothetical protein